VTKELIVVSLHPGVSREQVQAQCGWPLRFAATVGETPLPSEAELQTLRALRQRTKAANEALP